MSREEFLRRAEVREEGLQDWEEGEAVRMPPAHGRHGFFILVLGSRLLDHLRGHGNGRVWQEVFVDFSTRTYGVDLAVLLTAHLQQYQNGRIQGRPDVIVEVLSDGSIDRDRVKKFDLYQKEAVPFYWIGDPLAGTLEEYRHTPEGYVRTTAADVTGTFTPTALSGFSVAVADLMEA